MPETLKDINTVAVIDRPVAGDFVLISRANGTGPFRAPVVAPISVIGPYSADAAALANQLIAALVTLGVATDDRTDNPHTILTITNGGGGMLAVLCDGDPGFATATVVLTGTGGYDETYDATTTGAPANSFLVPGTYSGITTGGAWAEA
jgi:hypothetical protein